MDHARDFPVARAERRYVPDESRWMGEILKTRHGSEEATSDGVRPGRLNDAHSYGALKRVRFLPGNVREGGSALWTAGSLLGALAAAPAALAAATARLAGRSGRGKSTRFPSLGFGALLAAAGGLLWSPDLWAAAAGGGDGINSLWAMAPALAAVAGGRGSEPPASPLYDFKKDRFNWERFWAAVEAAARATEVPVNGHSESGTPFLVPGDWDGRGCPVDLRLLLAYDFSSAEAAPQALPREAVAAFLGRVGQSLSVAGESVLGETTFLPDGVEAQIHLRSRGGREYKTVRLKVHVTGERPARAYLAELRPEAGTDFWGSVRALLRLERAFGDRSVHGDWMEKYVQAVRLNRAGRFFKENPEVQSRRRQWTARAKDWLAHPARLSREEAARLEEILRAAAGDLRPVEPPPAPADFSGNLRADKDGRRDFLNLVFDALPLDVALAPEELPDAFRDALDRFNARGWFFVPSSSGRVDLWSGERGRYFRFVRLTGAPRFALRWAWHPGEGLLLYGERPGGDPVVFAVRRYAETLAGPQGTVVLSPLPTADFDGLRARAAEEKWRERLSVLLRDAADPTRPFDEERRRAFDEFAAAGYEGKIYVRRKTDRGDNRFFYVTLRKGQRLNFQSVEFQSDRVRATPLAFPGHDAVLALTLPGGRTLTFSVGPAVGAPLAKSEINAEGLWVFDSLDRARAELAAHLGFSAFLLRWGSRSPADLAEGLSEEAVAAQNADAPVVRIGSSGEAYDVHGPRTRRLLKFNGLPPGTYRPRVERDSLGLKIVFVNADPDGPSIPYRVPPFPVEGDVQNFYSAGESGVVRVEKSMLTEALEPFVQWALSPDALAEDEEPADRQRERRAFNARAFTVTTDETGRLPFSFSEAVPAPRKATAPDGVLSAGATYRLSVEWLWGAGPVLVLSRRGQARVLAFGRWRRLWGSGQKTVALDWVADGTSARAALAAAERTPALLIRQAERLRLHPTGAALEDFRRRADQFNAAEAPRKNDASGHAFLDDPFDGARWVFRRLGDADLTHRRHIEWRPGVGPVVYFLYDGPRRLHFGRVKAYLDLFRSRSWSNGSERVDLWPLKKARAETLEASRSVVSRAVDEFVADPVFGRGTEPNGPDAGRFLRWVAAAWASALGGTTNVPDVLALWSPRLTPRIAESPDHFYVRLSASSGSQGRDAFRAVLGKILGRSRRWTVEVRNERLILTARPLEPGDAPYRCDVHLTSDRFFDFACRFFGDRLSEVRETRRSVMAAAGHGRLDEWHGPMVDALKTLRSAAYYFGRRVNVLVTALGPLTVGRPQGAWRQVTGKYFNSALFKLSHLVQGLERVERDSGKSEFERRYAASTNRGAYGPAWPLDRDDVLVRLAQRARGDIDAARRGEPSSASRWPAHLPALTGNEKGRVLVIDWGGTRVKFRVVDLEGGGGYRLGDAAEFTFTAAEKRGPGDRLFDRVAEAAQKIAAEAPGLDRVAFVFSFPVEPTALDAGRLTRWTKEITAAGVEGRDVAALLREALARRGSALSVNALVNDAVGALAGVSYADASGGGAFATADAGLILGTGVNAAVRWDGDAHNLELGQWDLGAALRSADPDGAAIWSRVLSLSPTLEKEAASLYLGETLRRQILGDARTEGWSAGTALEHPFLLRAESLSAVAADASRELKVVRAFAVKTLGMPEAAATPERLQRLQATVREGVARSARWVAAAVAGALLSADSSGRPRSLGVDGRFYAKSPGYAEEFERSLRAALGASGPAVRVRYLEDATALGAAVIAVAAPETPGSPGPAPGPKDQRGGASVPLLLAVAAVGLAALALGVPADWTSPAAEAWTRALDAVSLGGTLLPGAAVAMAVGPIGTLPGAGPAPVSLRDWLSRTVPEEVPLRIADLGAGDGSFGLAVAEELIGLGFPFESLTSIDRRVSAEGRRHGVIEGDVIEIEDRLRAGLADGSQDLVFIHRINDLALLAPALDMLKDEGALVLSFMDNDTDLQRRAPAFLARLSRTDPRFTYQAKALPLSPDSAPSGEPSRSLPRWYVIRKIPRDTGGDRSASLEYPAGNLLHTVYVRYDLALHALLPPRGTERRVLYGGAGVDVSNALLSTDGDEIHMLADYRGLTRALLDAEWARDPEELRALTTPYRIFKYEQGWGRYEYLETPAVVARHLWREFVSLGIDPATVGRQTVGNDLVLDFTWRHPREPSARHRRVVLQNMDLLLDAGKIDWDFDVYYQRAPMRLPDHYWKPDSYPVVLSRRLRPGGVFLTDDISDHGFLGGRHNRSGYFPLVAEEVAVPSSAGEPYYLSVRRAREPQNAHPEFRGDFRSAEGYGWHLRLRRFPEHPPRARVIPRTPPSTVLKLLAAVGTGLAAYFLRDTAAGDLVAAIPASLLWDNAWTGAVSLAVSPFLLGALGGPAGEEKVRLLSPAREAYFDRLRQVVNTGGTVLYAAGGVDLSSAFRIWAPSKLILVSTTRLPRAEAVRAAFAEALPPAETPYSRQKRQHGYALGSDMTMPANALLALEAEWHELGVDPKSVIVSSDAKGRLVLFFQWEGKNRVVFLVEAKAQDTEAYADLLEDGLDGYFHKAAMTIPLNYPSKEPFWGLVGRALAKKAPAPGKANLLTDDQGKAPAALARDRAGQFPLTARPAEIPGESALLAALYGVSRTGDDLSWLSTDDAYGTRLRARTLEGDGGLPAPTLQPKEAAAESARPLPSVDVEPSTDGGPWVLKHGGRFIGEAAVSLTEDGGAVVRGLHMEDSFDRPEWDAAALGAIAARVPGGELELRTLQMDFLRPPWVRLFDSSTLRVRRLSDPASDWTAPPIWNSPGFYQWLAREKIPFLSGAVLNGFAVRGRWRGPESREGETSFATDLLHDAYVRHDLAVHSLMPPRPADGRRVLYGGSGVDVSNALLSTDGDEFLMVSHHRGLDRSAVQGARGLGAAVLAEKSDFYRRFKYSSGFGRVDRLTHANAIAAHLWAELTALRVDPDAVHFDQEGKDLVLEFPWRHPTGGAARPRRFVFRDNDLLKIADRLDWPFDVYYQRAGLDLPARYRDRPNFLVALSAGMRPGGLFATDDFSDTVFGSVRDHRKDFPLDSEELPLPEDPDRPHYLAVRHAGTPARPSDSDRGISEGYGWDVRVRRPRTYPPQAAPVSTAPARKGWGPPLAFFLAGAAALAAAHWGFGDLSQGLALAGGVFLGSLQPVVTDEFRLLLDLATDPGRTASPDRTGPGRWAAGQPRAHEIRLAYKPTAGPRERTRMAYFKTSVGGRPFSLSLAGPPPGVHRVRFSSDEFWPPLLYLSDPATDRTWAFSLEPFRSGRARNGGGSAALLADPFESYSDAAREAPERVRLARWLNDRRNGRAVPAPGGLSVNLVLGGEARSGGALVDPATGNRLIRLESRAFTPGKARLDVAGEALRVTQGDRTVFFELDDVVRQWGGKLERSPRESLAHARAKEGDLATRKRLARRIGDLVAEPAGAPSAALVRDLGSFNREAEEILVDGSGVLSLLLPAETARRLRRSERAHLTVAGFRPGGAYRPRFQFVARRGPVLVLQDAADPLKLHAFALGGLRQAEDGKKMGGLTPLGVFQTPSQIEGAAVLDPLALLEEAAARAGEWSAGQAPDLEARAAAFNLQQRTVKATLNDGQGIYLESPFTGAVRRIRTQSHQNSVWTLSILLSAAGPVLLARAVQAKVREPFKAYGPMVFGDPLDRPESSVWRGDRGASLAAAATALTDALGRTVAAPRAEAVAFAPALPTAAEVRARARGAVAYWAAHWGTWSPEERRSAPVEVARLLQRVLGGEDRSATGLARTRDALLAAEILFNDKFPADAATLYGSLVNADAALLSLLLSREGAFEKRRTALVKRMANLVFSAGLTDAATLPRHDHFLEAMFDLARESAKGEARGRDAVRNTALFLALLAPIAWLAAAIPGGLWPGVEFLTGRGLASLWDNPWIGSLAMVLTPFVVPGAPRGGDAGGLLHPSFVAHDLGVWGILRDQSGLAAEGRRVVYGGAGVDLSNVLLSTDGERVWMIDRKYGFSPELLRAVFGKDKKYLDRATASYAEAKHKAGFAGFTRLVPGERMAEALWRELSSLGIDPAAVAVGRNGNDVLLEFPWSHPGRPGARTRTVVFRESDLVEKRDGVDEAWDVYYQRAPMTMPEAYAQAENYLTRLETLRRANGVYVTDDVTDFLQNRPGPGARADRHAQFPLRSREWPVPEALENAVLEFKYPGESFQRLRDRLTEGFGYGWRVRVREPLARSASEGRSAAIDADLTEGQRRSFRDALERLSPAPFEGMPVLQTLTLADWAGGAYAPIAGPTSEETGELARWLARWADADVRAGAVPSSGASARDAARLAAVLDELNHPWGENNTSAAAAGLDLLRNSGSGGDPAAFVGAYNAFRRALWSLRFQAAELNRRSVKAIDLSPLFDDARAAERAATVRALELSRGAPAGGTTHLLVDWEGLRSSPEESDGAILSKAEARLNREFPGLIRPGHRVVFRVWVRGTSAAQKVFRTDGLSVRSLRRFDGDVALPLTLVGVSLDRIVPAERRFLADWLVSLVPLAGLVSADLDAALRRLAFLQIQA
ncbi:MAG: hypothetical protein IPP68_10025 [Elusimicrobia bacterium]|nr:hypothetical protein [Elusimicrobiota bacterium]